MVWTGDEMQLLLETLLSFKSKKSYEGIDWEFVKEKYELIKMTFSKHSHQKISQDFMESCSLCDKRLQQKQNKCVQAIENCWILVNKVRVVELFRLVRPDIVSITSH